MIKNIRNIIFDLDGTLLDSIGDIAICLKEAYESIGGRGSLRIEKKHIGPPLTKLIKELTHDLSDVKIHKLVGEFNTA